MNVIITGATGFVGRALVARLLRDGHRIVALVRSPERASSLLGAGVSLLPLACPQPDLVAAMARADAVVNLAGENIFGGRWTVRRKRALVDSRVGLTGRLVEAMKAASPAPGVLLSASAVGVYGDRADEPLGENAAPGEDFLARLTARWESAARQAEATGARVVLLRTGIVLGAEGGALGKLLPLFRLGLGGRLGSGRQHVSWVHQEDLAEIFATALTDCTLAGPVNAVAPEPVTNREFTHQLARALGRPALLPVPGFALHLAQGEAARVLLGGQNVDPAVLRAARFSFRFPDLGGCLDDLLDPAHDPQIRRADGLPRLDPWGRRPQYTLTQTTALPRSPDRVFDFFSRAENLGLITPAWTDLRITSAPARVEQGSQIDYILRLGPLRQRWRTEIAAWEAGRRFVDLQLRGPYRLWWHEHSFKPAGDGSLTHMSDTVHYALPGGPLGRLAHRAVVAGMLRRIFAHRLSTMRLLFGPSVGARAKTS